MSESIEFTWIAKGVDGHMDAGCSEYNYTSAAAPVEADEYERVCAENAQLRAKVADLDLDLRIIADAEKMYREAWDTIPTDGLCDLWDWSGARWELGYPTATIKDVGEWVKWLKLVSELGLDHASKARASEMQP